MKRDFIRHLYFHLTTLPLNAFLYKDIQGIESLVEMKGYKKMNVNKNASEYIVYASGWY